MISFTSEISDAEMCFFCVCVVNIIVYSANWVATKLSGRFDASPSFSSSSSSPSRMSSSSSISACRGINANELLLLSSSPATFSSPLPNWPSSSWPLTPSAYCWARRKCGSKKWVWKAKNKLYYISNYFKDLISLYGTWDKFESTLWNKLLTGIEKCEAAELLLAATPPKAISKLWFCNTCRSERSCCSIINPSVDGWSAFGPAILSCVLDPN